MITGNVLWRECRQDGDELLSIHIRSNIGLHFKPSLSRTVCAVLTEKKKQKISLFFKMKNFLKLSVEWIITIYVYMEPDYEDIVDLEQWFMKIAGTKLW